MKNILLFLAAAFCLTANAQIITTIAGTGSGAYSGDGGPATAAKMNGPASVAFDASGNLYIADMYNSRIRKINTSGIISTVVGTGTGGFSGDGGPATAAQIYKPYSIAFDAAGNLYISDYGNMRIRMVNTSGVISTVAGNGTGGFSGDGGAATSAELYYPNGIALDAAGNLYIADGLNNRVRMVNTSGIITTVAGTGVSGFSGDGGPATSAKLAQPSGVAIDASGNLYIADWYNSRVRMVNTSGVISTVVGNGTNGFSGDGAAATSAAISYPTGINFDTPGNLYVSDYYNNRIRKVTTGGIISTVAGSTTTNGFSGDGGPATAAKLFYPNDVILDATGNMFIADDNNNRIRRVGVCATPITVSIAMSGTTAICPGTTTTLTASGATTYSWNTGATTASITPTPSVSTNYTVVGVSGTCANTATAGIAVNPLPTISVSSSTVSLCAGSTATLTASGASTYSWNTSATTNTIAITPTVTTSYTVTGTDANGCKNTATIGQNVINCIVTGTVCFSSATNYSVGTNPVSITTADFNNDGKKDLATANANSNNVSINLGTGPGTFGTPTNFAAGTNPSAITSADFNGDGKADLAVTNGNSANVSILLGTGTGSFGAASNIGLGSFSVPWSVISADFNSDGKKDLAVGYSPFSGTGQVGILLGTGTGTFGSLTSFPVAASGSPWGIVSADLNGDTKLDLATANYGADNVSVLLGTGTGSFGAPTSYSAGIQPVSIVAVDFNGDGKKDLATANYASSSNLSVFINSGTGTFGPSANYTLNFYGWSITSADFDLDGKADLAVANGVVSVVLGTGTGAFGSAINFNAGSSPQSVISADFNSDGKIDLATANNNSNNASILLNCTVTGILTYNNEQEEINIYPNPSNGTFNVETNIITRQTLNIYDINGQVVLSQSINGKTTIDADKLNEGVYFVNIGGSEGVFNKKLIIIK